MNRTFSSLLLMAAVGFCGCKDPTPPFTGNWLVRGSGTTESLRGLHVVDADVAWASGSGGTFLRTSDGADTWRPIGEGRFHAVGFSADGATGIAVGMDGLAGTWQFSGE